MGVRLERLQDLLRSVVESRVESVDLEWYSPQEIADTIKAMYKIDGYADMETNGWQVDFWITYIIYDRKFVYSGGWYYGGAKFTEDAE